MKKPSVSSSAPGVLWALVALCALFTFRRYLESPHHCGGDHSSEAKLLPSSIPSSDQAQRPVFLPTARPLAPLIKPKAFKAVQPVPLSNPSPIQNHQAVLPGPQLMPSFSQPAGLPVAEPMPPARKGGALDSQGTPAVNTNCMCQTLSTCVPTAFQMVPEGANAANAAKSPRLAFRDFKRKYSELHRKHKHTQPKDKPVLRVTMLFFGPEAPLCQVTVFIRAGATDFATMKQIFVQGEHSYLENIRHTPKIALDAGANVGMSSVYFSLLFPGATIYSLEPDEDNFEMLRKNTAAIPNIHPIRKGLSDAAGTRYVCDRGTGWAMSRFLTREKSECPKKVGSVEVTSVPQLMQEIGLGTDAGFDFVKMDIEGGEQSVFSAADLSWVRPGKVLSLELHERYAPGCTNLVRGVMEGTFGMTSMATGGEYAVYHKDSEIRT